MSKWQPIESAPKGRIVLVFDEGYIGKALYDRRGWIDIEVSDREAWFDPPPTHWMPLPDPPEVSHE